MSLGSVSHSVPLVVGQRACQQRGPHRPPPSAVAFPIALRSTPPGGSVLQGWSPGPPRCAGHYFSQQALSFQDMLGCPRISPLPRRRGPLQERQLKKELRQALEGARQTALSGEPPALHMASAAVLLPAQDTAAGRSIQTQEVEYVAQTPSVAGSQRNWGQPGTACPAWTKP